jgi:hypothetical protein
MLPSLTHKIHTQVRGIIVTWGYKINEVKNWIWVKDDGNLYKTLFANDVKK